MASYEKLVRDLIPEILDQKNVSYEVRVANDTEYRAELINKLSEEVTEFIEDVSSEELADVLEVIDALLQLPEFSNTKNEQTRKRIERGGFEKRLIVKGEK